MLARLALGLLLLVLSARAHAQEAEACAGTPHEAVMTLPPPLSQWGTIVCTPYGHIISNHDGWIWSNPGSYSPVFIPSQMVRNNPKPLANQSYFTQIKLTEVDPTDPDAKAALSAAQEGHTPESPKKIYRLNVAGSLGRSLVLYFFDWGPNLNGIWCADDGRQCSSKTVFMLLNMRQGS